MSTDEAIDFAKVDTHLDSNPKIRKAGCWGRQVFEFVLRVNSRLKRQGDVPLQYVDPEHLAEQLMFEGADRLELARNGLARAIAAKLLEVDDETDVVYIVGWGGGWGRRAQSGRERQQAFRDRKRRLETASNDSNGSEERRGDPDQRGPDLDPLPDELPDPGAIACADLEAPAAAPVPQQPPPGVPMPGRGRDPRVQLNTDAWRYAAMKHAELSLPGSLPWPVMPVGEAKNELVARTREVLAQHDPPRFDEAKALITRRIEVAFAAAKREGHAKWFTPMRMWDPKSFWIDCEITPEQAAQPRASARGTLAEASQPRRIKTLA